jgi:mannan endo-1,4-beta-mannosidase
MNSRPAGEAREEREHFRADELRPIRPGEFVTRDRDKLVLAGEPFRFFGSNAYYLEPEVTYGNLGGVTEALDKMVLLGMSVVRTIGYNDQSGNDPSVIRSRPGSYREAGLAALDQVVSEAKQRQIRLILWLTGSWGGVEQYIKWYKEATGRDTARSEFFINRTIKLWFKEYVEMLVNRVNTVTGIKYSDEPAILAWELGNELRNDQQNPNALLEWEDEMSGYIKKIDPNHLVADGGEGFDDDPALYPGLASGGLIHGTEGTSFHRILTLPNIDLASYHLYPRVWGLNEHSDAEVWIRSHEALARKEGRVAYLGEYGSALKDKARSEIFEKWLQVFHSAGGSGCLLWGLVYDARPDYDEHSVYYPKDFQTGRVLRKHASIVNYS